MSEIQARGSSGDPAWDKAGHWAMGDEEGYDDEFDEEESASLYSNDLSKPFRPAFLDLSEVLNKWYTDTHRSFRDLKEIVF